MNEIFGKVVFCVKYDILVIEKNERCKRWNNPSSVSTSSNYSD